MSKISKLKDRCRSSKILIGMALCGAILLFSGCAEPYQGNPAGRKVAVIGDSITEASYTALHASLNPSYYVSVSGRPQTTIHENMGLIEWYRDNLHPQIVVLNFGANEIWRQYPEWIVKWDIAVGANTYPPETCVLATTASEKTPWEFFNNGARSLNEWIRTNPAEIEGYIDWNSIAQYTDDGLHPNELGKIFLASLTRQTIEKECLERRLLQ